jgi:predicted ArsR family transcriptional regulator
VKTTEGYGPLPADVPRRTPPLSKAQSRVLAALEGEPEPVTMTALADTTGLHPNTLREHLEALVSSGRVRRHRAAPSGPGRPRTLYETVPADVAGRSEYAGLAGALAATIHRPSEDPQRHATEAGVLWGR